MSEAFRQFISERGFEPPAKIEPGRWCPFSANGKRGNTAGRAKLFLDGEGGYVHDWITGKGWVWQAKRDQRSEAEQRAWQERLARAREEAEAEQKRDHEDAAERAREIWGRSDPAPVDHGYLVKKKIKPHGARVYGDALVVPVFNCESELRSLDFIKPDGMKRGLGGGEKSGNYFPFGEAGDRILVCEGFSTGASLYEATGYYVVVAFGKSNLGPVARLLRRKHPSARIGVCGDNDADGGGQAKAKQAADAVGGTVVLPPDRLKDWNDVHANRGLDAVRAAVETSLTESQIEGPSSQAGSRIVALTMEELLQRQFPPMEAFLSPWLRKQNLALIYSWRGVGKTHFCLNVAYAVASGGRFLKWQAEKPRKVLYIDGEMPGSAMRDRLAAIVKASKQQPPPGFFRIITPDVQVGPLPDLGTPQGQVELDGLLADAELIVVDNLSCLCRSGTENEGESWLPMAEWALAQRREGRAVLFAHHEGKNGAQRGASRREDLLDIAIRLKHPADYRPESGAQFVVKFEKSRALHGDDVEEIEAVLTQTDGGVEEWTWRGADEGTRDRVLELVKLGLSDAQIAEELGVHRSTAFRARKKAEAAGLIPPAA